ncbi:flagellar basal body-associated FliL family protein [Thermoclostridium stercorarium]|uniref:flagellar basal body-associated FliL family protein n=1 Tax=Thermoclostridium stercorarium TaxID=1510 RepID=UPI001EED1E57|nr:flagellar basal body-associated FliL family protein [Thermoclostridium stercorarium]
MYRLEKKGVYTVLLSIIAVLSLALAVLIIFLFISYPNMKNQKATVVSTEISDRYVADDELAEFKLFGGEEKVFALKDEPDRPDSIALVSISIKCDVGEKRKNEERINNLISLYKSELEQAVGDYFANITYTEAKAPEFRSKAREELMEIFNNILNENKQAKQKIIYKVMLNILPQ